MRRISTPDHAIAALATRQSGVVTRSQLWEIGLSESAIDRRLHAGRLHRMHPGVYAVGHPVVGADGLRWAAVLACGLGATLSHWTAAIIWELCGPRGVLIDVTVPRDRRVRRSGVRVHRPLELSPDEVTTRDGLPVTTGPRTVLDLAAAGVRGRPLEAVLDRAEVRARIDWGELQRLLERHDGRRGAAAVADTLARYRPGSVETRSVLEEIVLDLCDEHGIPRPLVNAVVEGRERDFFWPHARLVVEADGFAWHGGPIAFGDDRERDVELTLAGIRSLRFTYAQCTERRAYVGRSLLAGVRGSISVA